MSTFATSQQYPNVSECEQVAFIIAELAPQTLISHSMEFSLGFRDVHTGSYIKPSIQYVFKDTVDPRRSSEGQGEDVKRSGRRFWYWRCGYTIGVPGACLNIENTRSGLEI
jgi:hypothetical protein